MRMFRQAIFALFIISTQSDGTRAASSCGADITIESKSSIKIEFGSIENATGYSIRVMPTHSTSMIGYVFNTTTNFTQVSFLNPDTLYDITVETNDLNVITENCTAHTYPEPIQVVAGEQPTTDMALIFVGSNPRVTEWEMELRNGTEDTEAADTIRQWRTNDTFFGFVISNLLPNTAYQIRARPSEIFNETVSGTEFGEWTTFQTAMLSVFGRVTLVNVSYQNTTTNDQLISEMITNASMEKGGFSSLKILNTRLHNSTGFTTVHYEIEVFEKSLPVSTNFTLSSEEFLESAINNGGKAKGEFFWSLLDDSTRTNEINYSPVNRSTECIVERRIGGGIVYTSDDGQRNMISFDELSTDGVTDDSSCGTITFNLGQENDPASVSKISNNMDYNTVNVIGIDVLKIVILDQPEGEFVNVRVDGGKTTLGGSEVRHLLFFNKNIHSSNLGLSNAKYTIDATGNSATIFFPNVPKSVKYQVGDASGTRAILTLTQIDGSEFVQIKLDNLTLNSSSEFQLTVTTRTYDGGDASASSPFDIDTTQLICGQCGVNEICYRNVSDGNTFCDCDIGFESNGTTCVSTACAQSKCSGTASCMVLESTDYPGFSCTCEPGFSYNGTDCFDDDECDLGTHSCNDTSQCVNTDGGYICKCDSGYSYNETNCTDDNECDQGTHSCNGTSQCANTDGSYTCECDPGFTYNRTDCEDDDECTDESHDCHQNSTCINTVGSYECICNVNFTGNGTICTKLDDCSATLCHPNAFCQQIGSSVTCICNTGYTGNGTDCTLSPFDYNISLLNATTIQITTNRDSGSATEISVINSYSIHSDEACGDVEEDIRTVPITNKETIIRNLLPGHAYRLLVRENDSGEILLNETRLTGTVSSPDSDINIAYGDSSIGLSWTKLYDGIAYQLSLNSTSYNFTKMQNTTESNWTVNGLQSGRKYLFCAQVAYCHVPPTDSNCFTVYTIPSANFDINTTATTTSVMAQWKSVRGSTKYIASLGQFTVRRKRAATSFPMRKETNGTSVSFDSLQPGTTYTFSIAAMNEAGTGAPFQVEVTTDGITDMSTQFPWWWIVIGIVLLAVVITLIVLIARRSKRQREGSPEFDGMQERADDSCCSCWRAIFHVTQKDETSLDGQRDTLEEPDGPGCCPWKRILNIGGKQKPPSQPQRGRHAADASSHARTSNADGQSESHTYSDIEQTQLPVCCPWIRNFQVSKDGRKNANRAAPNTMPRDKPPKGCCGWAAIFWVNKEERLKDDEHVTTEI